MEGRVDDVADSAEDENGTYTSHSERGILADASEIQTDKTKKQMLERYVNDCRFPWHL